jgi:hypothetical protein
MLLEKLLGNRQKQFLAELEHHFEALNLGRGETLPFREALKKWGVV